MPYSMIICEMRRDVAIIRLNDEKTLNAGPLRRMVRDTSGPVALAARTSTWGSRNRWRRSRHKEPDRAF
jgi:hypothetical protein